MSEEFWEDLYKVDATDSWINGAYTEQGDQVYCDGCHEEVSFDPESREWRCRNCGNSKTRAQWFSYIEALPPGPACLINCQENYPLCKNWCLLYKIPDNDPIL